MFRGSDYLNLDVKGRLAVPTRYRNVLHERCGGHLVITADPDGCLLIYPLPEWEVIQQQIDSLSNLDPRVRDIQRRLVGFAMDTEMDAAGRLLVSPPLRQRAALDKNVVLVGQGKKFELWDQARWEARTEPAEGLAPGGLPPQLENLSL